MQWGALLCELQKEVIETSGLLKGGWKVRNPRVTGQTSCEAEVEVSTSGKENGDDGLPRYFYSSSQLLREH